MSEATFCMLVWAPAQCTTEFGADACIIIATIIITIFINNGRTQVKYLHSQKCSRAPAYQSRELRGEHGELENGLEQLREELRRCLGEVANVVDQLYKISMRMYQFCEMGGVCGR